MKISKVRLKNFKYFDDITLETNNKNIIMLLGPNGIGKSCIFDAIYSASQFTKYKSNSLDESYHKKNRQLPTEAEIILEDGTPLNTRSQVALIRLYGRTSYRFSQDITRNQIGVNTGNQVAGDQDGRLTLNQLDIRVENDVEVALAEMLAQLQSKEAKSNLDIVSSIIKPTNESLERIFGKNNLQIKEILSPLSDGGKCDILFVKKEVIFNFKNLSSGEKEVFDIIFNFHRRQDKWIKDGIYYIDEPELHINTKIQRTLFEELVKLANDANAQIWIATHSLGFMRGAQELASSESSVALFEFKPEYAVGSHTIIPKQFNREDWKRIFETALDDLSELISPEIIYYCEGKSDTSSGKEEGFDAIIYKIIFADCFNLDFVSSGGGKEVKNYSLIAAKILQKLSSGKIKIFVLKDGDHGSTDGKLIDASTRDKFLNGDPALRILSRLELENYLLDKSVLHKFCSKKGISLDEEKISNIDFVKDNLKSKKQKIKKAISYSERLNQSFYNELAGLIRDEKDGDLKDLYNSLAQDLKL